MQNNNITSDSKNEAVESTPMPPPPNVTKPKANANKNVKEEQEKKASKEIVEKNISKEENVENLNPEKKDAEKEDGKKPSKKSKKNKNKKAQAPADGKTETQVNNAASKPVAPSSGKKASQFKGEAPTKEVSQGDKKSESKKGEKKEAKKDSLSSAMGTDIITRLQKLEEENAHFRKIFEELKTLNSSILCLSSRVEKLEKICSSCPAVPTKCARQATTYAKAAETKEEDDVDLFGSDDEDDPEKERIKAERLKMYEEKKSKKPTVVAKSNIILDVKPWDDETDMKQMEVKVREVNCPGLLWGASKLVPLAYGIHKLQISCVIEDDLVSVDWLQEQIEANEDLVQSVDIAAFNKV